MAKITIDIDEKNIETIIKGMNSLSDIIDIVSNLSTGVPIQPVHNTIADNISKVFAFLCYNLFISNGNVTEIENYIEDNDIPLDVKVTKLYGDILRNGDSDDR